jgi:hypothetical protein
MMLSLKGGQRCGQGSPTIKQKAQNNSRSLASFRPSIFHAVHRIEGACLGTVRPSNLYCVEPGAFEDLIDLLDTQTRDFRHHQVYVNQAKDTPTSEEKESTPVVCVV